MEREYWLKQASGKPLFPDLLWSRPENKRSAGKLLIIGGNLHGFAAPAEAYQTAVKTGIGTAKVLLPDALKKTVGRQFEAGEYAPSTPSGSFSKKALTELIDYAAWADGVLLAGDLGRNSETAILLENFLDKYQGQATITKDAIDYFYGSAGGLLSRENTTLVLSLAQLQRLSSALGATKPVTFSMGLLQLVDLLHELSAQHPVALVVKHQENIFVACGGQVSTTKLESELPTWRVKAAARTAVWRMQNPGKSFEAITTSVSLIDQN